MKIPHVSFYPLSIIFSELATKASKSQDQLPLWSVHHLNLPHNSLNDCIPPSPHHVHYFRYDAFQNPRYAWTCCKQAFFMIAEGFPDCSSNSSVTRRGANEVCISLLGPGLAGRASPPVWISIRWNLAEHSNLFDPKASAFVKPVKPRQARCADHYY